jgi:uncharacterized membrane protein
MSSSYSPSPTLYDFLLALAAFLAAHVLPARLGWRDRIAERIGERSYQLGYSLLSVVLLAWLIKAALAAPVVPLWPGALWQYHLALGLMVPACILLVAAAFSPNPLSISFHASGYDRAYPGIVGVTRHPLLWGFALWSIAHLVANGDLVSLILFGGFGLFSFGGLVILDRRKRRQLGTHWPELAAATSVVPFVAWFRHPSARRWRGASLLIALGGGAGLYALLLTLHPLVIGPDPASAL